MAGVLRGGRRVTADRVVVYVAPGEGPSRGGWIAGRRVGGAVARNRARRILRETWRALVPMVREGLDVVLVARPGIGGARTGDLVKEVGEVLARAGMMRDDADPGAA